jgi:spermidine synthase
VDDQRKLPWKHRQGWFSEGTVPGARFGTIEHTFRIDAVVFEGRSKHQEVLIFDHAVYGRVFVLDGIVQFSSIDQTIYHEMLVHPVLACHGKVEDILVIGGGDGGTIRECLRHQPRRIVMVDLDPEVIALCRRYLPELSAGAFDDPRVCLVHEDGAAYVANSPPGNFDAVIVDGGDYSGLSAVLFSSSFFGDIARVLRPGGVVSLQTGSVLDAHLIRNGRERLSALFADVTAYRLTMPSYHCGEYCFLAASLSPILSNPDAVRLSQVEAVLRSRFTPTYWSQVVQRAAQVLPASFP